MALPQKNARIIKVPIVLDAEVELAYLTAKHEIDVRAEELLRTAADRIRVARAGASQDNELAAAEAVVAADTAEIEALKVIAADKKVALDEQTTWFTFRALGRKTWIELCRRHPPTAEDHEQWTAQGGEGPAPFNEVEVARELFHLACVVPGISPEEADEIIDGTDWNATEVMILWTGARYVQIQGAQA